MPPRSQITMQRHTPPRAVPHSVSCSLSALERVACAHAFTVGLAGSYCGKSLPCFPHLLATTSSIVQTLIVIVFGCTLRSFSWPSQIKYLLWWSAKSLLRLGRAQSLTSDWRPLTQSSCGGQCNTGTVRQVCTQAIWTAEQKACRQPRWPREHLSHNPCGTRRCRLARLQVIAQMF